MNLFNIPQDEREFTRRFASPSWMVKGVFLFVAILMLVELPLLFFFLTPEAILRVQALNGALVIGGSIAWLIVMSLMFMMPMRRLAVYQALQAEKIGEKIEKLVVKLETELDGVTIQGVRSEVRNVVKSLDRVAQAFTRPIPKPPIQDEHPGQNTIGALAKTGFAKSNGNAGA